MSNTRSLIERLPNDIGDVPAAKIDTTDRELEAWEKRCHALADVLDFRKLINTEEKRCGVEALGSDLVAKLSYYILTEPRHELVSAVKLQLALMTPVRPQAIMSGVSRYLRVPVNGFQRRLPMQGDHLRS